MTWTPWYRARLGRNGPEWKNNRQPTISISFFPPNLSQRLPKIGTSYDVPCPVQLRLREKPDSILSTIGRVNKDHNQFYPQGIRISDDWPDAPNSIDYEARFDLPDLKPAPPRPIQANLPLPPTPIPPIVLDKEVAVPVADPVPMLLWCPECHTRHLDVGEFATKIHHTHACQNCGHVWRPAIVPTVGVRFLPGFKNDD